MPALKYTKELLEPLVKESYSIQELMRKLGLKLTGGSHSHLKRVLSKLKIDTTHFLGCASNRGKIHKGGPNKLHYTDVLVLDAHNGRREAVFRLRRAMIEAGFDEICEQCGLKPIWNNKPIVLQIDHKDGNGLNNLKGNLRFLCPNCHSQTETYGAKNIT